MAEIKEKEWFCRHCGARESVLVCYCSKCHSEDSLIRDKNSFNEGKREGLKDVINFCLELKGKVY